MDYLIMANQLRSIQNCSESVMRATVDALEADYRKKFEELEKQMESEYDN